MRLTMMPAVALSDFVLGLENAGLAWLLVRRSAPSLLRRWFVSFFAASGLAAAVGGAVHAWLPEGTPSYRIAWSATLLIIGATAFAAVLVAAHLAGSPLAIRAGRVLAGVTGAIYAFTVVALSDDFAVAAWDSVGAAALLLAAFLAAGTRPGRRGALAGAAGVALVFGASLLQQARFHLAGVDHNTLYHALLMLAMALVYAGARAALATSSRGAAARPGSS
jgi:hypothetical protein